MIYKYLDENTLQPIIDKTLKFATTEDLNDPFENLARPKMSESDLDDQIKRAKKSISNQQIFQHLPEDQRIELISTVCESIKKDYDGSTHNPATLHLQIKSQRATANDLGILSLTTSSKNALMWSHYASKHQGYAIGFDETHAWFNSPTEAGKYIQKITPIKYSKHRCELDPNLDIDKAFAPFLQKSPDWEYENEFRVLYPLSKCQRINNKLHLLKFPDSMIKEVIFGFRCPRETVDIITKALSGLKVEFYRAMPSSISYDMELVKEEDYVTIQEYENSLIKQAEAGGIDVSSLLKPTKEK